jgi:hypothetical protein
MILRRLFSILFFILVAICACSSPQAFSPTIAPLIEPSLTVAPSQPPIIIRTAEPSQTLSVVAGCPDCSSSPVPRTETPLISPTPTWSQATVKVEKLDVWDDPVNENSYWHRQTQLITGEQVIVIKENGDWTQIIALLQPSSKDKRGYPGWVRSASLVKGWDQSENILIVSARTSFAFESPNRASAHLMRLYFDTRIPFQGRQGDFVQTVLPDGRTAWLLINDVLLPADKDNQAYSSSLTILLSLARTQSGAPYLWGGTTSDSPDCSGFIYRLFHIAGITLARDANDQVLQGQVTSFSQKKAGDLIFYTDVSGGPVTHVGLYLGNNQIMDANPWLGLSIHPLSDMQKWYVFYSVRRIID